MGDIFPVFLQVAKHKYVKAHSQPLPVGCVLLILMSRSGQAISPAPFAVRYARLLRLSSSRISRRGSGTGGRYSPRE